MDLAKQAGIVDDIRAELSGRVNTRLKVCANMGRSKIVECEGTLKQAHPSLFIMVINRKRGLTARQSYQYVDILTGMVKLSDPETGQSIFESFSDEENPLHDEDSEFADDDTL